MLPFCTYSFEYYLRVLEQNEMKQSAKPKIGARIDDGFDVIALA